MNRISLVFFVPVCLVFILSCTMDPVNGDQTREDTTPPTVIITAPATGVSCVNEVTIIASVVDNDGVETVSFLIDGVTIGVDNEAPYQFLWYVYNWADGNPHTILVEATDTSGNVALSDVVTVSVPSTVINVDASAGEGSVELIWDAAYGASSYNIYWSESSGATVDTGTEIIDVSSPYTHSNLTNFTVTYHYVVAPVYPYGESRASSEVQAVPGTNSTAFNFIGTYNGHTYWTSKDRADWDDAKLLCEQQGGHLITLGDSDENDFLIQSGSLIGPRYWIGFVDGESQQSWVTGEPVTFTYWASGEPNIASEDVVEIYGGSWNVGRWNDAYRTLTNYFILEIEDLTAPQ